MTSSNSQDFKIEHNIIENIVKSLVFSKVNIEYIKQFLPGAPMEIIDKIMKNEASLISSYSFGHSLRTTLVTFNKNVVASVIVQLSNVTIYDKKLKKYKNTDNPSSIRQPMPLLTPQKKLADCSYGAADSVVKIADGHGLLNVMVSNGMNTAPI